MRSIAEPLAEDEINELMADADKNNDGKIDFDGETLTLSNVLHKLHLKCIYLCGI